MTRSTLLFVFVFSLTVAAGFAWIQRGKWLAAAQATTPQLKTVAQVLSPQPVRREDLVPKVDVPPARDFAPQIELPNIDEVLNPQGKGRKEPPSRELTSKEPSAPSPRLLLDRWPMP